MRDFNNECYQFASTNVIGTVDNPGFISKPMIGHKIRAAREAKGWSQADLGKRVGISQVAIKKIEAGDTKQSKFLPRVLVEVGLPLAELGDRFASTAAPKDQSNAIVAGNAPLANTIPVYGQAIGGRDGAFVLNGNKIADILAPASLAGIPDAYAVYVVGDSMEPRYFAGEAVFVSPRMPVRKGDFVVVQVYAGEGEPPLAYIKRFVSQDGNRVRLEQYNPKKRLEFATARVVSVHKIVMGGEG